MRAGVGKLVEELAKHKCVMIGEFRLSSGLSSPYYIDLRMLPSYPGLFDLVADAYVLAILDKGIAVDRIAGVATAGIPIATLVAYKLGKPLVYARREERAHGTQRLVEGVVKEGDRVLLIDDVATTGESLRLAAGALKELGANVEGAMVLVDREQGAKERLAEVGVRLLSLMTSTELMNELLSMGLVSKEEYDEVIGYIRRGSGV